ncbi:MAG: hypothetical protein JXA28_09930 [Bacteroidetes bacterium]|nr:hypothetical protein [Bacteroidota bacterium]
MTSRASTYDISVAPSVLHILGRPGAVTLAGVYGLLAMVMTHIRLLDTLGYESALAFGLLAAWVGGMLSLIVTRDGGGREEAGKRGSAVHSWLRLSAAGAMLLFIPVAVLVGNAAFVRNCALLDGVLYWLLIPFATILFSTALVLFLRLLFGGRAGWAYYLVLLLLLIQPVVQIFTRPQIYAYNHVFGMFLGLSWDQTQPPFLTLVLYRLSTLAYTGMLLSATAVISTRRKHIPSRSCIRRSSLVFTVSVAVATAALLFSDDLGFSTSYAHLERELGSTHRQGAVTIIHDSSVVSQEEIRLIAEEHRFQLERVCAELGVRWEGTLTAYLYPDSKTKKRLLGTESSELARPWRREIHITYTNWNAALKHEIVHVVAGAFGPYVNRAPFVRVLGLTEGLAMAVEWSWGNRTLHQHAAAMMAQEILPSVRACIGTAGFVTKSSSVSYVSAGSFTRWMIDTLGMAVVRRAYAADDVEGVTGLSYEELDRRWRAFLHSVPRQLPDSIATAYAFRRPSLFSAECPRVVTERSREAAAALERRDGRLAERLYRETERLAPNARAVFGIVSALFQQGRMDSVRQVCTRYLRDSSRAYSVWPLQLWLGAAAWAHGDSLAAGRAFTLLLREQTPGWPTGLAARMQRALQSFPDDSLLRSVLLGALLREENEDSLRMHRAEALRQRLGKDSTHPVLIEEWLLHVAVDSTGRSEALPVIRRVPVKRMHRSLRELAGRIAYRSGKNEDAAQLFRAALEMSRTEMERVEMLEWLDRIQFRRQSPAFDESE